MRPEFLGDSFDIVKRFYCEALQSLGFTVYIDPLLTGSWVGEEELFYRFLGVKPYASARTRAPQELAALFLDPDTGVNEKGGKAHVSFDRLAAESREWSLVFSFDQAFSRAGEVGPKLQAKLDALAERDCVALYYASHAHFLFVSREPDHLQILRKHLISLGMPESRLVGAATRVRRTT